MDLDLTEDQKAIKEVFSGFFTNEAPPTVARAAEPFGFDRALWNRLLETGAPGMGVPALRHAVAEHQAHRYGLEILPMLGYSAPWAVAEGASGFAPPRNVADWEDFVETCVARYSRPPFNLRYFQVWNEPTLKAGFWKGETDDEFFERVYLPAARIIRRYGCKVVFSGWPCSDGVDALAAL